MLPAKRTDFRRTFVDRAESDTVRAFVVFGLLLVVLLGVAIQLAFREADLGVLTDRLALIRHEAEEIARTVAQMGREEGTSIDFSRIRSKQSGIRDFVHGRFAQRYFLHHVELRDRFGVRQLFISRDSPPAEPAALPEGAMPVDWPQAGEHIIRVPLGTSEGEVRVGLHSEAVLPELAQIRRSLRVKVAVAAALAVGVLVAGFFYVLRLLRRNRALEQSRQSAARASYVGLLASGLAHEIRNPLNAVNMNLQMLEEELPDLPGAQEADYNELLESTKNEIKRLESLVNNFLTYARPGRPNLEKRDLNLLVDEVMRFLESDFRQSEVELRADLEPLLPHVELDDRQFKQALINLLVNARQVLGPGGTVTVRTRAAKSGEMVVEVADDGPGIPEASRERIFEVFYSTRGGGTGLGLPIAKQIVERHGGSIRLASEEGVGTTFSIRLPRRHDRPAEPAPASDPEA